MTDAELIAALLARLGGSVTLGAREIAAAEGWRIEARLNHSSGDVVVSLTFSE